MRMLLIAMVLAAVAALSMRSETVHGSADAVEHAPPAGSAAAGIEIDIDGDEDDVLEVQLLVLGLVVITVFVFGTAAYLLRRKLGLTDYTPPADSGHH